MKKSVDIVFYLQIVGLSAFLVMPIFAVVMKYVAFENTGILIVIIVVMLWTIEDFLLKIVIKNVTKSSS